MLDLRSEEELMEAAREGDDQAFQTLTLRLRTAIERFLRHMGCNPDAVDDLTQETLLRVWRAREGYEARARLRTYVLGIARNLWLSHCGREARRARRRAHGADGDGLDRLLLGGLVRVEGPEAVVLARYRAYRVREAILALPERQRSVFVLAHIEDMPYSEIAQMLGIAEGTVKSRMSRAVRGLRRELEGDFAAPRPDA